MDAADPLREIADRFTSGRSDTLYFDANSIGAAPAIAATRMAQAMVTWRDARRRAWGESDWLDAPTRLGDKLAPIVGAAPGQIVVGDSTSVNLFKALAVALRCRAGRSTIVTEIGTFPTDLYIAQGIAPLFPGVEVHYVREDGRLLDAIDADTAVVYLSHVDYRSSYRHDLARMTRAAHEQGAVIVWDLSHSAGANEIGLDAAQADFAVGCGYKYLCGGPGAPGYLYVAKRWQSLAQPALTGWMGHADLFAFAPEYVPAPGVARHIVGTPAVIANVLFEAALDAWQGVDVDAAFAKHAALTGVCVDLAEWMLAAKGVSVTSPREAPHRGGFVSLRHEQARAIVAALDDRGVVTSYRLPDVIRLGMSPLYHHFTDVWDALERLGRILDERAWDNPKYLHAKAT